MALKLNGMRILITLLIFLSFRAHSFYTEIGASYSFGREVYGENYQSKLNENTVLASVAFYFFSLTGLELSYSWRKWDNLDKTFASLGNDEYLTGSRRTLDVMNFGVGITQYFTSTKAILRPGLGVGWVRRITEDDRYVDIYNDLTGETERRYQDPIKTNNDLIYLLINLKFRIVEGLFLSGSVRTLFAPKKYQDAPNNLRFFIGFSWLF